MEVSELRQVRRNLDRFLRRFEDCIKMKPTRRHLRTYVRGQVSDLERKSVEPMALEAGVAPRTLQEFLGLHRWDHEALRRRVREVIQRDHGDQNAIAVVDETGCPKKGDKTAGVQRQYCGATGKTDNCVVTVHLGYATSEFHALVDSDLYLPRETWHEDRERCREAGIPDEVVYRPKWRIALELLQRAIEGGMSFRFLAADEEYGAKPEFRQGVAGLGLTCVVEVPCSTFGWTKKPRVTAPGPYSGRGRPRRHVGLAPGAPRPRRVDQLWSRRGPCWQAFHIKDTENGPVVWEVRAGRFFPSEKGLPTEECRLLVARNTTDGEVKYFLSNAALRSAPAFAKPASAGARASQRSAASQSSKGRSQSTSAPEDIPTEVLLHVAFSRSHIERLFQDAKMHIGFDHFEVRRYLPLVRHMIVSLVSLLFLMKETNRLRGEKSLVERAPGAPGGRSAARSRDVAAGTHAPAKEDCRDHRIRPTSASTCRQVTQENPTANPASPRLLRVQTPEVLRPAVALSC